jgi:hypothetical protein
MATNAIANAVKEAMNHIAHQTEKIGLLVQLYNDDTVNRILGFVSTERVYIGATGTEGVYISVAMYGLDSLKDHRLMGPMENILDIADIEWKCSTEDYPASINRDYRLEGTKDGRKYVVNFQAYVKSDSPTCRKVKIGQETQVVDKYEIVCE